jgi:hypothetical protein
MSLLNFIGCSSTKVVTNKKLDNGTAQIDINKEIYLTTKDQNRYYFPKWSYQILNDTLFGEGTYINNGREIPFNGKVAINDIEWIEQNEIDIESTTGLTLGIIAIGVLATGLILLALIADSFNPD